MVVVLTNDLSVELIVYLVLVIWLFVVGIVLWSCAPAAETLNPVVTGQEGGAQIVGGK